MAVAELTIDLGALCANWQALSAKSQTDTGAVVKANAYGLGLDRVGTALAKAGARQFFVAATEEGAQLRDILGAGPDIFVFSGHMSGDTDMIRDNQLTPLLNSIDQMLRHVEALPGHRFGLQLDTGMNRLGMEDAEWRALREIALAQNPALVMSHLACADAPEHPMNQHQLRTFTDMTDGIDAPRSLAATGGTLLGEDYHFDLTRPGVGMYGGLPFAEAQPVATLSVPVIQTREVLPGETVGYSNTWTAEHPTRVATIAAGYADGIIRTMGQEAWLWSGDTACKVLGRISMDLIGVDVTELDEDPDRLELLNARQTVDTLAEWAGTIGYEILTSMGARYQRRYIGA
ncbi:alanine racemase [Tropicibacter sp. R15_0]|uniref:alanine racemase n=1 Tax=Tropicibacter sp. R15_0 TaxID=2821101 RepID=UPI001ADB4EA3|nr:alanine racemase [Tropicibacter sp. R15_0]MBO9464949.1 alanine racemase [Tropicibacter sp. R15_0]